MATYYPIDENTACLAKQMNSYGDYVQGSATTEYRAMVDKAAAIAEAWMPVESEQVVMEEPESQDSAPFSYGQQMM